MVSIDMILFCNILIIVVAVERETFEVLMTDYRSELKIEKSVKLHLKDYNNLDVSILKINKDGFVFLLISELLNY